MNIRPFSCSITLLMIFSASCLHGQQDFPKEETDPGTIVAAQPETASLKMPEALAKAGFTKFAGMIEAAGLKEDLEQDGPFTCFAPTDDAIQSMPEEVLKKISEDPKGELTVAWIKYHFVKGVALKHEHLMKIPGANGYADRYLRVWVTPEKIAINRVCELTRFDIEAANGVIHESSRVLDVEDEVRVFQKNADN